MRDFKNLKIAVAGTGYVGLSIATLLSQHHKVMAVDIVPEKVELINSKKSPIQEEYIEKYLAEKELDLTATLDAKEAYSDFDFVGFVVGLSAISVLKQDCNVFRCLSGYCVKTPCKPRCIVDIV